MENITPPTRGKAEPNIPGGRLEARYLAFLETITHLRPSLHRYCARMTGSVLDGEDIVQESLFLAYRKLETFDDSRSLSPWLYRIAYNRCIDLLRRRRTRETAEAECANSNDEVTLPVEPVGQALGKAVEHLVLTLPPKERACVLLKDVFDYSLEEIAGLVDSTTGGVKAALHRGRSKLAEKPIGPPTATVSTVEVSPILRLYVERFNRRDWAGVRELISVDAGLYVADRYSGALAESPYLGTYDRMTEAWRLSAAVVDGEEAVVIHVAEAERWVPKATVRLRTSAGKIVGITDYWFCPWMLPAALGLHLDGPA